jgi:hypothetical protein
VLVRDLRHPGTYLGGGEPCVSQESGYFGQRLAEELAKAADAKHPAVKTVHMELAALYRERLAALGECAD